MDNNALGIIGEAKDGEIRQRLARNVLASVAHVSVGVTRYRHGGIRQPRIDRPAMNLYAPTRSWSVDA